MIIHNITLCDFGIFAGEHSLNFKPNHNGRFQQPITLLRGQNGVGKSTIMEAIRLALHGKLSLGNRTSQKEYETYLINRLHRNSTGEIATKASIELTFDHVFLGQRHKYQVRRLWTQQDNRIVSETQLWIDDAIETKNNEEKEHLLRELVPPGIAELFFFDGEKITTLSDSGNASDALLSETVKNLLGLNLIELLDQDLDVYLTRQTGIQEIQKYQDELRQIQQDSKACEQQRNDIRDQLLEDQKALATTQESISLLESRIAKEGGQYAIKEAEQIKKQQGIQEALAQSEQQIQEICRGVFPFSVAPKLLADVRNRLEQETEYETWKSSQPFVKKLEALVIKEQDASYNTKRIDKSDLLNDIQNIIEESQQPPIPEASIVHKVSAETRGVLFNWIDEAQSSAPQTLAQSLHQRSKLHEQLAEVQEDLKRVPIDKILQPLQDKLREHEREIGRLEAETTRLIDKDSKLTTRIDRLVGSSLRVSEQIAGIDTDEERIKLAARTKLILNEYQEQLTAKKLTHLALQLTKRFNQLSRKQNFIDKVNIDPKSFAINLYRAGELFPRNQLSAGEDQIFAIATLWALREVSGWPLPVIIDTPLSRLDDEHRRTMLAEFMPQVAQQVIVLATNIEIDDDTAQFLQPALAREYHLMSDGVTTQVTEQAIASQQPLITLEEITQL